MQLQKQVADLQKQLQLAQSTVGPASTVLSQKQQESSVIDSVQTEVARLQRENDRLSREMQELSSRRTADRVWNNNNDCLFIIA